jgi:hypothetical protein
VKKVIAEAFPENSPKILTPRDPKDLPIISQISEGSGDEIFIIDDFHRLEKPLKEKIANLAKMIAEREDRSGLPKIVIVGINEVGADLIQLVPDIAKRIGIHKISSGNRTTIGEIIDLGSEALNVEIEDHDGIFKESEGDYWLTQQLCKTICISDNFSEAQPEKKTVSWENKSIRDLIVGSLQPNYDSAVREFCRGRRFRPSNDPYFKLLKAISEQEDSNIDLNELANSRPDIKGSINNIKDHRLTVLLEQKELCARLFYYDSSTKNFALEDPALFYYLKHLDWNGLRQKSGFRETARDYEFDIAISFAGENRELASFIVDQLEELDISTFYDKNYEDNYLGGPWSEKFREVFVENSRLVVALLDENHKNKVWPTFERDCFDERVSSSEVIPVLLDNTVFPGFSKDLVSIHFDFDGDVAGNRDRIIDDVVLRIASKLDTM